MKKRVIKNILLVIFMFVLFFGIGLTNEKSRKVSSVESFLSGMIALPQNVFHYLQNFFAGDTIFFSDIEYLKKENQSLKEENEQLKNKMIDYEIMASENETLKEQDKIRNSYTGYEVVVSNIIAESASNWDEIYVIDKGSKDGIKPDMTVITTDGLVGYVESVGESTSKVVSILNAGNSVSSRVTRTRDLVICKGTLALKEKGKIKVTSIPMGIELLKGDKIETSGMGGVYPKGIAIGEIESFENKSNPLENEAILKTNVDFNKLETVAVIIRQVQEEDLPL